MELVYKMIDQIGMMICFGCCIIVLLEKESKNQKYLLMTFLCGLLISVGNTLEFYAPTQEAAIVAVKVAYIGKVFIGQFAVLFAFGFSKIWLPKHAMTVLSIYNIALMGVIMSCENHALFYQSIDHIVLEGGRVVLRLPRGPFYFAWMAEFEMMVVVYSVLVFANVFRKGKPSKATRVRIGLLITSVSVAAILGYAYAFTDFGKDFDLTTVAVVFIEIFMLIDVKKFGLLDTMELAQQKILEDTKDGLIVVDNRKEKVLFANQVAKALLPEVMTQQNVVLHTLFEQEERVFEREGRHFEVRISEIKERHSQAEVQGYFAWIFDMTFINHYTTEILRMKEASEQANRAKTNFLAHMSHEIRTPMNAIIGYAELALRSVQISQMEKYVRNIRESSQNLLQLINEILDISKIEAGKMEIVEVTYQFLDMITALQTMAETQASKKGLSLSVQCDENIPEYLYGDKVKVEEIILNLLNNALKYTKQGSVFVRARVQDRDKDRVQLHFEVEDTGIGIEQDNFSHVFEKFEQFDTKTNYATEGTGLGLSIVKKFVEMMGGTISFKSEYGKGTTFIVELWQQISEAPKEGEEEGVIPEDCIQKGNILVVDDNELNCDVAKGILECFGMEVQTADSGKACLERLEQGEQYDLIFMDHMMPEMEGVEVLHRIRSMGGVYEEIPVVVLTANAISGVKEAMLAEGFNAFLTKPLDIEKLKQVLVHFLGRI